MKAREKSPGLTVAFHGLDGDSARAEVLVAVRRIVELRGYRVSNMATALESNCFAFDVFTPTPEVEADER